MKKLLLGAMLLTIAWTGVHAETLTLFDAAEAGVDAWSWSGARVKASGDLFVVTENNRYGPYGDAFIADHVPYIPGAEITLDVARVIKGKYTLQAVCFGGASILGSTDLISNSTKTGPQTVNVSKFRMPRGTDSIALKVWVVEEEGASTEIRNLTYTINIPRENVLLDSRFQKSGAWEPDGIELTAEGGKGVLRLAEGKEFGSLLHNATFEKVGNMLVLLDMVEARKSRVTLQVLAFDKQGAYLHPIDAAKDVGVGWHGFMTRDLKWPAGSGSYRLKLWLSGDKGCEAVAGRVLIVQL